MKSFTEQLRQLAENDGLTLKNYIKVNYKSGYQVATEGFETTDPEVASRYIHDYNGNCGVWYSNGIYYIDKSFRVSTKKEALKLGREHNQISVLDWKKMDLVYC